MESSWPEIASSIVSSLRNQDAATRDSAGNDPVWRVGNECSCVMRAPLADGKSLSAARKPWISTRLELKAVCSDSSLVAGGLPSVSAVVRTYRTCLPLAKLLELIV